MELKDRLKELRESALMTQADLTKSMNELKLTHKDQIIYPQTVSYWENGREPSLNALTKMCKIFNVSSDYILGLTDKDSINEVEYEKELEFLSLKNLKTKLINYDDDISNVVIKSLRFINYSLFYDRSLGLSPETPFTDEDLAIIHYITDVVISTYSIIDYSIQVRSSENIEELKQKTSELLQLQNIILDSTLEASSYFIHNNQNIHEMYRSEFKEMLDEHNLLIEKHLNSKK